MRIDCLPFFSSCSLSLSLSLFPLHLPPLPSSHPHYYSSSLNFSRSIQTLYFILSFFRVPALPLDFPALSVLTLSTLALISLFSALQLGEREGLLLISHNHLNWLSHLIDGTDYEIR